MGKINKVKLGDILTESVILSTKPNPARRVSVRLNCQGVEKRPITNDVEGATNYFVRRAGQFIYGKQNLFKGAFGIIPNELDGFESSSDLPSFDISKDCLPEYLNSYFQQDHFYKNLESIARGAASKRISPKNLFEVEIYLPDLPTQKTIVARLQSLQSLHREADATLARLKADIKRLRQSILQDAIQGKLINSQPQPGEKNGAALLADIRAEKERRAREAGKKPDKPLPPVTPEEMPFALPEGWVWCRFGDVVEIKSNLVNPRHYQDLPQIAPECIEKNTGRLIEYRTVKEAEIISGNHFFEANSLIYSKVRPKLNKIVWVDFEGLCSADMYPLKPHINPFFVKYVMLSNYFFIEIDKYDNRLKMPKLNQNQLNRIPLPIPPQSSQSIIVSRIEQLLDQCVTLEAALIVLKSRTERLWKSELQQTFQFESNG